jgi:hypothetical protein
MWLPPGYSTSARSAFQRTEISVITAASTPSFTAYRLVGRPAELTRRAAIELPVDLGGAKVQRISVADAEVTDLRQLKALAVNFHSSPALRGYSLGVSATFGAAIIFSISCGIPDPVRLRALMGETADMLSGLRANSDQSVN